MVIQEEDRVQHLRGLLRLALVLRLVNSRGDISRDLIRRVPISHLRRVHVTHWVRFHGLQDIPDFYDARQVFQGPLNGEPVQAGVSLGEEKVSLRCGMQVMSRRHQHGRSLFF